MADKTQTTFPLNTDDLALDSERKQSQRLMIASSVSVAINLMFLIGAAQGMEEKAFLVKPERSITGVILINREANPTPAPTATPTPAPVVQIKPKNPEPKPRQTPPPIQPVERVQVVRNEPTLRVLVQPTPPPTPDVREIPDEEPILPQIKPVEEPVAATAVEAKETVQARTPRVIETTASNRMTGASIAMNAASAAPSQRGSVQAEINTSIAAPLIASGTTTLSPGIRAPRASVAEAVASGSTNIVEGEFTTPGAMSRQVTGAPRQRTSDESVANATSLAHRINQPRNSSSTAGTSGMIAAPTLQVLSGPTMGTRKSSMMQAEAGVPISESGGVSARGTSVVRTPGGGTPRTSDLGGAAVGEGVPAKVRGGSQSSSRSEIVPGRNSTSASSDRGPTSNRTSGVVVGSGANTSGVFRIKSDTGKADIKGTGSVESAGRVAIAIVASGGGGTDIVTSKTRFRDGSNELIQVNDGKDSKITRPVSAPKTENLSEKIDKQNIDSLVNARILSRKQPEITSEMKASNPRKVTVEFTVGANGSASYRIVSSSGNADIDAAVLKACAGYRWQAGSKGGKPASSRQQVTFDPNE